MMLLFTTHAMFCTPYFAFSFTSFLCSLCDKIELHLILGATLISCQTTKNMTMRHSMQSELSLAIRRGKRHISVFLVCFSVFKVFNEITLGNFFIVYCINITINPYIIFGFIAPEFGQQAADAIKSLKNGCSISTEPFLPHRCGICS